MLKRALLATALAALISTPIALVAGCGTEAPTNPTEATDVQIDQVLAARAADRAARIDQVLAARAADRAARTAQLGMPDALRLEEESGDTDYTGGHCNVRLFHCDPYPIGKGNHPKANAKCSQFCIDTLAYCQDYTTAELEWCCAHPDTNYHDSSGREYPEKHCMPSGEPNWETRCAPGLQP